MEAGFLEAAFPDRTAGFLRNCALALAVKALLSKGFSLPKVLAPLTSTVPGSSKHMALLSCSRAKAAHTRSRLQETLAHTQRQWHWCPEIQRPNG